MESILPTVVELSSSSQEGGVGKPPSSPAHIQDDLIATARSTKHDLEAPKFTSPPIPRARLPSSQNAKLSIEEQHGTSPPKKLTLPRLGVSFETLKDDKDAAKHKASNARNRNSTAGSLSEQRRTNLGSLPSLSMGDLLVDPESRQNLKAQKSSALHPIYLSFWESATEAAYRDVFLNKTLANWRIFSVVGIIAMIIFEVTFTSYFSNKLALTTPQESGIFAGVFGFLPLCIITVTGYFASREWLKEHIHLLSSLYIIFIGPVLICGRYFVMTGQYDAVTAPFYITQLFFFTFFLHLRFIHTVMVIIIAVPIWFGVFGKALAVASPSDTRSALLFIWSGVSLFFASIVICSMSYVIERNSRRQYISDKQYLAINTKLHKQLRGLQSAYATRFADLESPLEKALYGLRVLLASPSVTAEQIQILTIIQACLNSSNLMAPDLYHQVKRGEVVVDDEQEKWLFNEIAAGISGRVDPNGIRSPENEPNFPKSLSHRVSQNIVGSKSPLYPSFEDINMKEIDIGSPTVKSQEESRTVEPIVSAVTTNVASQSLHRRKDHSAQQSMVSISNQETTSHYTTDQNEVIPRSEKESSFNDEEALEEILGLISPEADRYLKRIDEYNFPLFELSQITGDRPLSVLYYHLVVNDGILDRLNLPINKFARFICAVERGYDSSLTFHNAVHAADVLHCIYHLTRLDRCQGIFSDVEILAIYTAAAIHDVDHPGVNNNFLIATGDRRAMLYNDKSVLENHHCAAAFEILLAPENNFVESFDKKMYRSFRTHVVDMVLATDLAQHFSLLTNFKKKAINGDNFDPVSSVEDRTCLMQMLMKCADVSNPTKEWPLYEKWIDRIMEEFFNQGDREKELGLAVSPFCNRDSPNTFSCQKGFIEFIVSPLFEALEGWTPLGVMKEGLDASRQKFCPPPPVALTGNTANAVGAQGASSSNTTTGGSNNNSSILARGRHSTEDMFRSTGNQSQLSSSSPHLPDRSKSPSRIPQNPRGRRGSIAAIRASLSLLTTNTGGSNGSLNRNQHAGPRSASILSPQPKQT